MSTYLTYAEFQNVKSGFFLQALQNRTTRRHLVSLVCYEMFVVHSCMNIIFVTLLDNQEYVTVLNFCSVSYAMSWNYSHQLEYLNYCQYLWLWK